MSDTDIERKLTLLAAKQPKTEEAQLMLKAAETIIRLRAEVNYERARADLNNQAEELHELYAKGFDKNDDR